MRSSTIPPAFSETSPVNLWSTIRKVGHVSLDPPKSTFSANSADYISAPGVLEPEIFTRAIHQGLLAHITNRVGVPPKILRANI